MKKVKLLVATLAVVLFGAAVMAPAAVSAAVNPLDSVCASNPDSEVCQNRTDGASTLIGNLVNALLFVVGTLSVVMIIIAGIQYTASSGDSARVTHAKNTLTYSIVGLVVSFLAYAIVNWVLDLF